MSQGLFSKSIQKLGVLSGFLEHAKLDCQSQESNLIWDFLILMLVTPACKWSGVESCLPKAIWISKSSASTSVAISENNLLLEPRSVHSTSCTNTTISKITAGSLPTSTQVCLFFYWCMKGFWEQDTGKDALLCRESFSESKLLWWLLTWF